MATMLDLLTAARTAGLPLEVTPDFASNGHNGIKVLAPRAGYLHHTDARLLVSVYSAPSGLPGWDPSEWRPTVPSPRCQVYAARARAGGCRLGCPYKGRAHLVFVSAGSAYQAGEANGGRISAAYAGRINASVSNAAAAGLADTVNANDTTMGVEIDWAVGENWPADLLELVCRLMALAVRTFGWPGVGSWIRHRQATARKVDPATDFDFWARAQQILTGDDMTPEQAAQMLSLLASIDNRLAGLYRSGFASVDTAGKPDPTHLAVSVAGVNQNLGQLETMAATLIMQGENNGQTLASILAAVAPPAPTA